ncbi:hypothetical protein [Halobacillus yeomjeoni]|uniref:Uncharacterized protein n=1 Tax=Halobacillus yeomjeoni TaxID=311194 RepID=A0A931HTQ3_9BACI|nr:hypothetical protein [Halobacillus yeomjeoni]MBH0229580.1 hypothetical protein [Halobacillus yeomjeoni]
MGAYWFKVEKDSQELFEEWTVYGQKFVRDRVGQEHYMYMDLSTFDVTPGLVFMDINHPLEGSPHPHQTAEEYIKRGCTLLLIQHLVSSIRHYREVYDSLLKKLEGLPLDYMIIPTVPAKIVRPEMVRYFARKGCPFLCIEVNNVTDFAHVSWEWLAQAQGHKRIPLTIFVKDSENTNENYPELWSSLCNRYDIIRLTDLQDDEVVSGQNLKDSGIFPHKGSFITGGQADYNLSLKQKVPLFDEQAKFRYHDAVPNVTVMNGKVKQVNQKVVDREPGSHLTVKVHKHFV